MWRSARPDLKMSCRSIFNISWKGGLCFHQCPRDGDFFQYMMKNCHIKLCSAWCLLCSVSWRWRMQHYTLKIHLQHAIINFLGNQVPIGTSLNIHTLCQAELKPIRTMLVCHMDLDISLAFETYWTSKYQQKEKTFQTFQQTIMKEEILW